MDDDERKQYRYTRTVLELLEQAHEARPHGYVTESIWPKWQGAIEAWAIDSRWGPFIVDARAEVRSRRFTADFVALVERARASRSIGTVAPGGAMESPASEM